MAEVASQLSATEPLDDHGSAVRFETHCVVIPDPAEHRSRRPRVVTKSYALPLWKKRSSSACLPLRASAPPEDSPPEERRQSHLVLRVPLPTFSRKHNFATRSVDHLPLPPCLVHRAPSSDPSCSTTTSELPIRHTRPSRKSSTSPSRSDIITVPLRPCCAACQPVTEAAVVGGDAWPEYFSRAASRRRSTSADATPPTITVAGSAASASYGHLGVSIRVDEIDKRRRSSDTALSAVSREMLSDDGTVSRVPLILRRTTASNSTTADTRPPPSPTCVAPATPRIPEEEADEDEDENQLFPLPSPKRTPTPSPAPSPEGSLSSLTVAQVTQGSTISPTPSNCSGDSAGPAPNKQLFLAPPRCSSSSSLSLPKLCESTTDLTLPEDSLRAPSPSLLSTLPTLSGRYRSRSPSPRITFIPPTPTDAPSSATGRILPELTETVTEPVPITVPSSPSFSQLSSTPPTHARFQWRSNRSVSADIISPKSSLTTPSYSLTTSPTLSAPSPKKSFSMSSSRKIIADVLRGVGTMGVSGAGPRM